MQITSNMSVDEVIRLFGESLPCNILTFIEQMQNEISELKEELTKAEKAKELIEEQNYFATELIGNLKEGLKQASRLNEYRKTFDNMLENSSFEL